MSRALPVHDTPPARPEAIRKAFEWSQKDRRLRWRTRGSRRLAGTVQRAKNGRHPRIYVCFQRRRYMHTHMVWAFFHGRWPAAGMVLDHIDGDTMNDNPSNLVEVTSADNVRLGAARRRK